jgi:hypothetical protein
VAAAENYIYLWVRHCHVGGNALWSCYGAPRREINKMGGIGRAVAALAVVLGQQQREGSLINTMINK